MRKSPLPSLKKKGDFKTVFSSKKFAAGPQFSIHALKNHLGHNRLGIQAGKKVGNAVVRNRVRRLVKECCRLMTGELNPGFDIVIVARQSAGELALFGGFSGVDEQLQKLLVKIGLL